jgi:NAD+ synthase (glutamine-hydrolysing)
VAGISKTSATSADDDVVFENAQARERTQILFNVANQAGGIVVGTGDLSELALGWCTFNADHMAGYNVNASVPKTMIRYLVRWYARHRAATELARCSSGCSTRRSRRN